MKIESNSAGNIGKLYQAYKSQAEQKTSKSGNAAESNSVQLSDQARKIHQLIKETKDLPDVREEKIAEIRKQIANHTYSVSPQQLAAKMLASDKD